MLETNTTMVTEALDLAIITPLAVVGGLAIMWGNLAIGYRIVMPLLVLLATLAPAIAAQSAFQVDAGVELPPGAVIGPVAGFVVLAVLAMYFVARILQAMESEH
jgi:hypothetical protein